MSDDPRAAAPHAGKVLVVDDLESNLRLLEQLLKAQGYDVLCASDGDEALTLVTLEQPDVIVSDVRMPQARRLRALPRAQGVAVDAAHAGRADDRQSGS